MGLTHRVAIAQIRPDHLDLASTMEMVLATAKEAAEGGAKLIVFGESVLPGYPAWLDHAGKVANWDHPPTQSVFARLRENSLYVPGSEVQAISELASELGVAIAVGGHERVRSGPGYGTLYNVLLLWNESGELAVHHRKLVPTHNERLVWGQGDAAGLHAADTEIGRVGGLICWEHWMPLARQALHDSGEDIHIAMWPSVGESHQLMSRHYAMEGRCFVLAAGSIMKGSDLPPELRDDTAFEPDDFVMVGGSAIIGPDGDYLAGPVFEEETIVYADLDTSRLERGRMALDVTGHYARPDVLDLRVDRSRRSSSD